MQAVGGAYTHVVSHITLDEGINVGLIEDDTLLSNAATAWLQEQTNKLLADLDAAKLPEEAAYNMKHELRVKQQQFQATLAAALGISEVMCRQHLFTARKAMRGKLADFASGGGRE